MHDAPAAKRSLRIPRVVGAAGRAAGSQPSRPAGKRQPRAAAATLDTQGLREQPAHSLQQEKAANVIEQAYLDATVGPKLRRGEPVLLQLPDDWWSRTNGDLHHSQLVDMYTGVSQHAVMHFTGVVQERCQQERDARTRSAEIVEQELSRAQERLPADFALQSLDRQVEYVRAALQRHSGSQLTHGINCAHAGHCSICIAADTARLCCL